MQKKENDTPNFFWSIFTLKCPRCRRGKMFTNKNGYRKLSLKYMLDMPEECAICRQKYDIKPGFWFGTSYVSYGLTIAISVATFVAWYVLIGFSVKTGDTRIYWCLGTNIVMLLLLQPWLMRISRVIYIRFFVGFDKNYLHTEPKKFE